VELFLIREYLKGLFDEALFKVRVDVKLFIKLLGHDVFEVAEVLADVEVSLLDDFKDLAVIELFSECWLEEALRGHWLAEAQAILDAHELEGIFHEVELELLVEGGVGGEAGTLVDLQQPGLHVRVDEHVEAEDLEALVVGGAVEEELLLVAQQLLVDGGDGSEDQGVDFAFQPLGVLVLPLLTKW